jgi:hypothetical protein
MVFRSLAGARLNGGGASHSASPWTYPHQADAAARIRLDNPCSCIVLVRAMNIKSAALPHVDPGQRFAVAGFGLALRQAVGPDRHLRAHCACGRHGRVHTDYWMARGWGDRPLAGLVDQVRCACGGRQLTLVVANGPPWPGEQFIQMF